MKIDVIIPVYRPTEKLHKVLYRLCRQTHLPEQIILLHTRDGIKLDVSVCKDRVSVTEIPILEKEFDHGRTREQGIWMSDADIVESCFRSVRHSRYVIIVMEEIAAAEGGLTDE